MQGYPQIIQTISKKDIYPDRWRCVCVLHCVRLKHSKHRKLFSQINTNIMTIKMSGRADRGPHSPCLYTLDTIAWLPIDVSGNFSGKTILIVVTTFCLQNPRAANVK